MWCKIALYFIYYIYPLVLLDTFTLHNKVLTIIVITPPTTNICRQEESRHHIFPHGSKNLFKLQNRPTHYFIAFTLCMQGEIPNVK